MNLRLTEEAIEGLDRLRTRHNASLTAIIEAIGVLAETVDLPPEVVQQARRIDLQRATRRPRD